MASAPCFLTLPIDGEVAPHRDGFTLFHGESQDFADARHAAYQACAAELQHVVDDVFDRLNQNEFERIAECLECSTRELQQQWTADQNVQMTPPYTQVPAALVHTGCSMADLGFTQQQLLRSLRTKCSPHVAVLRSRECTSLTLAVRSLVSQLVLPTIRCAASCTFDFAVLAGWYEDLRAGRVAASIRPSSERPTDAARATDDHVGGPPSSTVLPVVLEDVEHFDTQVLNDFIYAMTSSRTISGQEPLPLALVFVLPSGAEALQSLLSRSTLVLLQAHKFALATTERAVDQVFSRLLQVSTRMQTTQAKTQPGGSGRGSSAVGARLYLSYLMLAHVLVSQSSMLPVIHPSAVEKILGALVDDHSSSNAMVQQLHYCLIDHFRSNALSYFVPLRTSIPSNASCGDKRSILGVRASSQASKQLAESLDAVCSNLSLCQIDALYSLPSVASALDAIPDARGLQAREDVLKAELPRWLQRMGFARVRRACAMRCALSLLQAAFPGGNRHVTSARQLYLDTANKPLRGARAVTMALTKLREPTAISTSILHTLLRRCATLIRQAQPLANGELDTELIAVESIRSSFTLSGSDAPLNSIAASNASSLGSSVAHSAASSKALPTSLVTISEKSNYSSPLTGNPERPSAAKRRRMTLSAAIGGDSSIGSSRRRFAEAIVGWFEKMFGAHDVVSDIPLAEVWLCDEAISNTLEAAFNPSPLQALRTRLQGVLATVSKANNRDAAVCGWETAIAFELLRTKINERKVDVVDWFELFKSHYLSKRMKLRDPELLGHFVVALNNLQVLGFSTLSTRSRGVLDKMVYG